MSMEPIHGPGMRAISFTPSKFDPCLYYHGPLIFLVYIDNCIVFGPDDKAIDNVVTDLRNCTQNFTIDDRGEVGGFLGIQIQQLDDGSIILMQPPTDQLHHPRPALAEWIQPKNHTSNHHQATA